MLSVPVEQERAESLATWSQVTTSIQAGDRGFAVRLRELWQFRELLYFLAWRDVKVRYTQTLLGVFWAILQPLLTMLLFAVFFGRLAHVPSGGKPYAVFAYAGLLPWIFFSSAVTSGAESLISNPDLIKKVYVPRLLIPGAAVLATTVDFAIALVLMVPLMMYSGIRIPATIVLAPLLIVVMVLLALAVGSLFAALNVEYRDVRHALPFFIQLWLFVSPVIYPSSMVPPRWRPLLMLNPLTGIIEAFRASWFGTPIPWRELSVSAGLTLVLLVVAVASFRRMETSFVDEI